MPPCSNMSIPRGFPTSAPCTTKKALKIEILQPLSAPKAERHLGVVKSFNSNSGFGFIECKLSNDKYSRDVFLHKAQAGEIEVGTVVEFAIDINERGMPQARDVKQIASETAEAAEAHAQMKQTTPPSPSVTPPAPSTPQQLQQIVVTNPQLAPRVTPQLIYQPVVFSNGQTTLMNFVPILVNQIPTMTPLQLA